MPNDPQNPQPPIPPTPDAPAPPATPAAPPFAMPQPAMPAAPAPSPAMPPFAMPSPAPVASMPGAAPPWPGFAPPMQSAMPAPAMPAPAMPAAHAHAHGAHAAPVLGVRDEYRFAEEPVAQRAQVSILETPKVAPELPSPSKIDPGLEQLKIALEAQMARNAVAPMMYAPPNATRWFRFSPFELFMEQVLARKLWTLE